MASRVKRFIQSGLFKIILSLFVGLSPSFVKGASGKDIRDTVLDVRPPFELVLKKTGPIRLANLLYAPDSTEIGKLVQKGMAVDLRYLTKVPDRYGRRAAHVYLEDGTWVQAELVRNGQAIPFPFWGEDILIRDLYALEQPKTKDALKLGEINIDGFDIVSGYVFEVAEIKGTTYLNFAENWRTDFTIRIDRKNAKKFRAAGFNLPTLKGKRVRIRGWVFSQNGPMISPDHPAQLEILDN